VMLLGEKDYLVRNEYTPISSIPSMQLAMLTVSASAHAYAIAYNDESPSHISPATIHNGAYSVYYPNVEAHVILGAGHGVVNLPVGRHLLHDNAVLGVTCVNHQSNCLERKDKCDTDRLQWRCASTCHLQLPRDTEAYDHCRMVRTQGKCHKSSLRKGCQRTCCGLKM
jgi:hypothetical protein